ncbi:MAG: hypothetical protein WDM70_04830 [Nitrosomonadales bacterium]
MFVPIPSVPRTALEDMSDLFRMAMAHSGDKVPVREEVVLAGSILRWNNCVWESDSV